MHAIFFNSRPHVRDSGTVNIDVKHIYLVIILYIGKITRSIQLELRVCFALLKGYCKEGYRKLDRL